MHRQRPRPCCPQWDLIDLQGTLASPDGSPLTERDLGTLTIRSKVSLSALWTARVSFASESYSFVELLWFYCASTSDVYLGQNMA